MRHLFEYYEFDNLSDKAQKNAIERVRSEMYDGNWSSDMSWVIDDDALFEPAQTEMMELFGPDYILNNGGKLMIGNTRKNISLVGKDDPNYYIHCADALDVTNDNLFLRWLGIPNRFRKFIYYSFKDSGRYGNTTIEFEIDDEESMIEKIGPESVSEIEEYFESAEKKFESHIDWVLTNASDSYDDQFTDDGVINAIESNDIVFHEDGEIDEENT